MDHRKLSRKHAFGKAHVPDCTDATLRNVGTLKIHPYINSIKVLDLYCGMVMNKLVMIYLHYQLPLPNPLFNR